MTPPPAPSLAEALERARAVADEVLFPRAQETDRAPTVPAENLQALRDADLLGLHGPVDVPGGIGADHAAARPVLEAVAGGCDLVRVGAAPRGGQARSRGRRPCLCDVAAATV